MKRLFSFGLSVAMLAAVAFSSIAPVEAGAYANAYSAGKIATEAIAPPTAMYSQADARLVFPAPAASAISLRSSTRPALDISRPLFKFTAGPSRAYAVPWRA